MSKAAVILGARYPEKLLDGFEQKIIKTVYGNVLLYSKGKNLILLRHAKGTIPPHRVNHKANICALNVEGVEKVYAFDSCLSINPKLKGGSFALVSDYVNFSDETFSDMEFKRIAPGFSEALQKDILAAGKKLKIPMKKEIYVQTKGPRMPTQAEMKIMKDWGSLVGMTLGTEATLAREIGLPYASLVILDPDSKAVAKMEKIAKALLK